MEMYHKEEPEKVEMKTLNKIWGVSLVVAVIASLIVGALPVSAGTNSWGTETIPSTSSKVIVASDDAVTPALLDTEIIDMAVASNGSTIYATLYQSDAPAASLLQIHRRR
jgi:hypothetical protein